VTPHSNIIARLERALPEREGGGDGSDELSRAAVAVLLVERDGETHVPLTIRASTLSRQPGQVSLPGGRIDSHDASAVAAAQRETQEELGVDSQSWRVLGVLGAVVTAAGFSIVPVVGELESTRYQPNPAEVERVFEMPLSVFADPSRAEPLGEREYRGHRYTVRAYHHGGNRIWGATARILECVCAFAR
jgi:8-oxo-dGTP pyrophosphatase MutT (NUDIX family)